MNKISIGIALLLTSMLTNAQSISLGTDNEYCPNIEYEFTVTLPGPYSSISATQFLITQLPYAFNSSQTSFKFKGMFSDVNIKQSFKISYNNGSNIFEPVYKKVKSLFYTNQTLSCPGIQPNQTTIMAPLCKISNIPISFASVKWYTEFENPQFCFGTITTYEYQLPVGWKLNNITSTGSNWILGTNNVTVTSDLSTGGVVLIRQANNCTSGLFNGQIPVQIPINRPQGFAVTPANVSISCGSITPVTFTINNLNNITGITNYTWNLGPTPNGWLLPNGNPAPQSYSTGMTNTLSLIPVCGFTQSDISASITVSGINCNANTSTVTLSPPAMNINGNTTLCSGSSVYTLSNVPCNASVTWSASPASGIISLSPNGNSVTVTKTGAGRVSLMATINVCSNFSIAKDILVGGPTSA